MNCSISILCREVNVKTGQIASYLCKRDVSSFDIMKATIRQMYNEDLSYYAITTDSADDPERLEEYLKLLRRRSITKETLADFGGIELL